MENQRHRFCYNLPFNNNNIKTLRNVPYTSSHTPWWSEKTAGMEAVEGEELEKEEGRRKGDGKVAGVSTPNRGVKPQVSIKRWISTGSIYGLQYHYLVNKDFQYE